MPDAPDLLAAFADYCDRLEALAVERRRVAQRSEPICGVPWPVSVDDEQPMGCELAAGHAGDLHWHWSGGVDVTWPMGTADE